MIDPQNQLDFNFSADDLLEFPRDLGEEGWFQFHSEQRQAMQQLERRFGVVLNRRVRLRLNGRDEDYEGRLLLDSLLIPSPCDERIRLRLGRISFDNTEIEYLEELD
ncbi:MAG: hypothetical protein JXR25_12765 [Pontiellaceae bacterium]|nr:hypothetical protein [Pontiellaceae bacterium]MBN2785689.1 hypothetical protein [Pontiellaceae bacterium]